MVEAGFRAQWLQVLLTNGYFTEDLVQNYEMSYHTLTAHELVALSITDREATEQLQISFMTRLPGAYGSLMPRFRRMLSLAENGQVPTEWVANAISRYEQLIHVQQLILLQLIHVQQQSLSAVVN